jgi:hypothetical protein
VGTLLDSAGVYSVHRSPSLQVYQQPTQYEPDACSVDLLYSAILFLIEAK